jgi:hypothetical protein
MIEEIFTKNSIKKPLILKNCTLFIDLEHYDIGTTYLFRNQANYKVEEFGNEWVINHIKGEFFNKGYFSSPLYSDFMFGQKFNNPDIVAIIGYSGRSRYYVSGISIGDNKIGDGFVCKFRFLDLQRLK